LGQFHLAITIKPSFQNIFINYESNFSHGGTEITERTRRKANHKYNSV